MTWLLIRKFWPVAVVAILLGIIWFQAAQVSKIRADRARWEKSAHEYQQSSGEWEASFRQAEKARQDEATAAVGAINASEATCDARVVKARSSAVKIERIVSKPAECKPGEAIPRSIVNPADLADSLR